MTGDYFAGKRRLEARLDQTLGSAEVLFLRDMFDPEEEHPETMVDFLKAFRAGYEAGYEDGRIMFEGEPL